MRFIGFLLLCLFFNLMFAQGQSTFKVVDRRSSIYLFAPNPISYSKFGLRRENIRLNPVNGFLDSVDNQAIWTPYPSYDSLTKKLERSYLLIEEFKGNKWVAIDSIEAGRRRILPKYFTAVPRPINFCAYPVLVFFTHLEPSLPDGFSHLDIDSMVRVLRFDVVLMDSNQVALDTLSNLTNSSGKELRHTLQNSIEISYVQFVNIWFESKLWSGDRFRKAKVNDSAIYEVVD